MYSFYLRERIIRLHELGNNGSHIVTILKEEGFKVSKSGVHYVIKKYEKHGTIHDLSRSGRPNSLSSSIHEKIDDMLKADNELTTANILNELCKQGITTTKSSVSKAIKRIGWTAKTTRYCQLIRQPNKQKRLDFCNHLLSTNETFKDIIFTDEAMVQLNPAHRKTYHKAEEARRFRPKPKHPIKVFVWGGISTQGATNVVIFTGIMDAELYTKILSAALLPFMRKFPEITFRFQQDNDPKHTSRVAKDYLARNGINWWCTPAESPDLNPIERVWSHLKQYLTYTVKPHIKETLVNGIKQFWREKLTIMQCRKYINHIRRVVPVIIEKQGEAVVDDELPRV